MRALRRGCRAGGEGRPEAWRLITQAVARAANTDHTANGAAVPELQRAIAADLVTYTCGPLTDAWWTSTETLAQYERRLRAAAETWGLPLDPPQEQKTGREPPAPEETKP